VQTQVKLFPKGGKDASGIGCWAIPKAGASALNDNTGNTGRAFGIATISLLFS
jgi:hypothetical protein